MDLDARKYKILKAIIDDYILTAMPVGSRTISKKYDMGLSSATIRNEMSDLYVDQLMRVASLPPADNQRLREIFQSSMDSVEDVLTAATRALSELTDYTGVMIAPSAGRLKRVQLVPITGTTALMVTVTENGVHKDSIIPVAPDVSPEHLYMLSNYLTERLQGKTLDQVMSALQELLGEMGRHRALFLRLMDSLVKQMEPDKNAVVVGGTSKLLFHPEYSDIERARSLLTGGAVLLHHHRAGVAAARHAGLLAGHRFLRPGRRHGHGHHGRHRPHQDAVRAGAFRVGRHAQGPIGHDKQEGSPQ